MGKLDPSQQDKWWKSRIEKEELQYGLKQDQQQDAVKPAAKEVTFLNTLGQPQVKTAPAACGDHLNGAGAVISSHRPQTAFRPPSAGPQDDDARSVASMASVGSAAKAAAVKPPSVASIPRTNKPAGSQAGTESQTSLVRRLDVLEEALAAERVKRLQAEEEMRQLVALSHQRKK